MLRDDLTRGEGVLLGEVLLLLLLGVLRVWGMSGRSSVSAIAAGLTISTETSTKLIACVVVFTAIWATVIRAAVVSGVVVGVATVLGLIFVAI